MEYRDYYATLGVGKGATQAEIKRAFRKLARQHHPDVNATDPAAERRFKEVNEAYAVLSDPEKRTAYDGLGADWEAYQRAGSAGGPFAGARGFPGGIRFEYRGDPEDLAGFSDFFRTFFAGGSGAEQRTPGTRTRVRSTGGLDLEDLLSGLGATSPDVGGRIQWVDQDGRAAGANGRRRTGRRDVEAEAEVSLEEVASGTERLVQVGDRRFEVRIPSGVTSGQRIRLTGKAGAGPGAGHVYLTIRVRPHPVFARDGSDLSRELPISLEEALLGAQVPVGTLSGRTLLLTIPAGTQNGRTFRLRGQGLPRFKAEGRGDLLVRTRVVLPTTLDEDGRRFARAFLDHVAQPNPREEAPPTGHRS
jgi:DnaJ-class molecular chaperone